jgi:membrane protease YdiL (CAAX protease family)
MATHRLPARTHIAAGVAPVVTFFALAYGLSWAWEIPHIALDQVVQRGDATPTHMPALMGPMVAALLTTALYQGRDGLRELGGRMARWRVSWRWWAVAFSPLLFVAVAAPVARVVDGDWPAWGRFDEMNGLPASGVLATWALITLLNGFGEETGWRGYALPQLQRHLSPLAATLILAALWALWHAPMFFFVQSFMDYEPGMLAGFFFGMACGAVVLTWLVNRSGSILLVAVWHGTYNLVSGTAGADGTVQAVVSTLVMLQAIVLVVLEIRAMRRCERGVLAPITMPRVTNVRPGSP